MNFYKNSLSIAISGVIASTAILPISNSANAQTLSYSLEEVIVTATRRATSVQDVPVNISALSKSFIENQDIQTLEDVARWTPGLTITDQGGRNPSPIIVRGLNTNSSGPDTDGETVATYIDEIPIAINMRLNDIQRVEVLIGPQGTLYGAGTMGGAIRYILNKPDISERTVKISAEGFNTAESDDLGYEVGAVFNLPLLEDKLALRINMNKYSDPGFIDYAYTVREGGVSLPDPDWNNPSTFADNIIAVDDANGEDVTTARVALRWQPNDMITAQLNYYYQQTESEGRSIVHADSLATGNALTSLVGDYESAYRYLEPREQEDEVFSLEVTADLGFAELVSSTAYQTFEAEGQRDQTDLLIRLDYGYESFPAFSAYTRELGDSSTLTQELRLVSTAEGSISWIIGGFYSDTENDGSSSEFTPGFGQFAIDNFDAQGNDRPDALEYYSVDTTEEQERALFGELSWNVSEPLTLTVGARYYEYEIETQSGIDLPLSNTVFAGRLPVDAVIVDFSTESAEGDGTLLKFNADYRFTDDIMAYFTMSEGFRLGGANGVAACPTPLPVTQIVCALPSEALYKADTTTNYELGIKSSWLDNTLTLNAALFQIDWDNAQVTGATVNGQQPITTNAGGAESKGFELSSQWIMDDNWTLYASYAYAKAKLTSDAPFLFGVKVKEDDELEQDYIDRQNFYDGKKNDRLSGSPEQQATLGINYSRTVSTDMTLSINYGMTYQSDIYTTVGLRADGEKLDGYSLSNLNAKLSNDQWAATIYVRNLFDEYAQISARRNRSDIDEAKYPIENSNGANIQRNYGYYINTPRQIGLRLDYSF